MRKIRIRENVFIFWSFSIFKVFIIVVLFGIRNLQMKILYLVESYQILNRSIFIWLANITIGFPPGNYP